MGGDDQRQWWGDRTLRYLEWSQTLDHPWPLTPSHYQVTIMQLFIDADQLRIEFTPMERFWAIHADKTITIPLAQIRQVSTDAPATTWQEIRSPGTSVPGVIKAGTYYQNRLRSFWYTRPKKPVLTLELAPDAYYQKIVLALNDNLGWRDRIASACNS